MTTTLVDFSQLIKLAENNMRNNSQAVHTEKWQGVDISTKRDMAMVECRHVFAKVDMQGEELEMYREQIEPALPWADDHFLERVCGEPINPGTQWRHWPYAHSAERFLDKRGKYNHNYMERYWPKFAGKVGEATYAVDDYHIRYNSNVTDEEDQVNIGIYHPYGDLRDVVAQLAREPHTRQAILPVFFPEDTGAVHGDRIPCSLFYQFFMRDDCLDVVYTIRSCDYVRHFRDDVYLTVRLLLWVLDELRKLSPRWQSVRPGTYVMLITSLHCFMNDYHKLWGRFPR